MRAPPRVLGPVDDADFRWVVDVGLTGPDKGAGGDYLFVPPGYKGTVPAQVRTIRSRRRQRQLWVYSVEKLHSADYRKTLARYTARSSLEAEGVRGRVDVAT